MMASSPAQTVQNFRPLGADGNQVTIAICVNSSPSASKPVMNITSDSIEMKCDNESASASAPLLKQLPQNKATVSEIFDDKVEKKKPINGVALPDIDKAGQVQLKNPVQNAARKRRALPTTETPPFKQYTPLPRQRTPTPPPIYVYQETQFPKSRLNKIIDCVFYLTCWKFTKYLTYGLASVSAILQAICSGAFITMAIITCFKDELTVKHTIQSWSILDVMFDSSETRYFFNFKFQAYFDNFLYFKGPLLAIALVYLITCGAFCYGFLMRKPWWILGYIVFGILGLAGRALLGYFPIHTPEAIYFWSIYVAYILYLVVIAAIFVKLV